MAIWLIVFGVQNVQNLNAMADWGTIKECSKTAANTIAIVLSDLYKGLWRKPDTSLPTLDQLNVVSFIPVGKANNGEKNTPTYAVLKFLRQKNREDNQNLIINGIRYKIYWGIPEGKDIKIPITIYSGGYSNGAKPYAYCGYTAIKAGLVPGACVTFDFPTDTRRGFNFCQKQDLHCVKTVCNEIAKKYPKSPIILHGACKGATNNLRFLAKQAELPEQEKCMDNIKAVIAESPPLSVKKALEQTPLSWVTLTLMRYIFPNYNPKAQTIMDAKKFPSIPVLIASLPLDTISAQPDVIAVTLHLNKSSLNNNVELFTSDEDKIQHGQIGKAKDYQETIKKFLEKNKLII